TTGSGGWTLAAALLGRAPQRTRLPVPMTPLVGREAERRRVQQMLAGARLVTLVGPGGIGKTRLSLAVGAAVTGEFADGAVFVPLADATDATLVVAAIARALGVSEVPGRSLLASVADRLGDAAMLLILDNFEQVIGAAVVVSELLAAAPGVSALVTSRERLSLYGERVFQVPPLPLPDLHALPSGADAVERVLAESPAVALFADRAAAATGAFSLEPDNIEAVAALCHRLDGLPLAIELAAARTDVLGPAKLLAHLAQHLDALGDGPRDLPARQQTLRGAIDWSYVLLEEADQRLLAAMSVFAGGWTLEAAGAVAPPDLPAAELAQRLDRLAGKSLLAVDQPAVDPDTGAPAGELRYRLLETIRAYAGARLADDGAAPATRDRHRDYFAGFAGRAGDGMTGPDQAAWADRLERDYQNLRAAIDWALERDDATGAAQLCLGLWRYWLTGAHLREGRTWLDRVVEPRAGLTGPVRASVLHAAAILATSQDDHRVGYDLGAQSLALAEAAGDRAAGAQAHNAMGIASINRGDYRLAHEHFQQMLGIWQELDDARGTAMALGNLTKLSLRLGDIDAADRFATRCLSLERAAGNTRGMALALECVGQIRLARGDVPGAREALHESLALNRSLADVFGEAMALHHLGLAAYADGDRPGALTLLTSALARRFELGDREDLAVSLECVAYVIAANDPSFAVTLLGAADGLRERPPLPSPPEAYTHREDTLAATRAALDEAAFSSALSLGRTAPLELIVDEALDLTPSA
ncbi:MAG TPA: AAA family ATPase, partial [Pilimelia sp.]|nr:AAA family ATPase [Pilimelia sp.]